MTALEDRDPGDGRSGLRERIMTTIESLKTFLTAERDRDLALKGQFAIGNPAWFVAEGERRAYQAAIDELERLEAANFAEFHQAFEAAHPGKAAEIRAAFEGAGEGNAGMRMSETIDGWEVVAIEPGLWCLRRPGYSAEIQASADGDNIDIADDAGRRWLYPPIAAIERLLALRRAALAPEDPLAAGVRSLVAGLDAIRARALAPEAQAPSGGPWRPAVGDLCLYYFGRSWLLARRIADQGNPEDDSDQEAFPQRFETIDAKTGCGYLYCDATYDGIRPLGSLPMPPSCGGEAEPKEGPAGPRRLSPDRLALVEALEWARAAEAAADSSRRESRVPEEIREFEIRREAYADCVRELERATASLAPPSIAEDLRTPEPGAFAGAVLVGSEAARNRRQAEVGEWAFATFGEISYHHGERVTRLLEEAVELAQAEGLDELSAMDVVHRVFEKPAGDWRKDVGAVGVTLLAYCHSRQVSADEREAAEWDRVKAIDPETMRARQNAKAAAGYGLQAVRP